MKALRTLILIAAISVSTNCKLAQNTKRRSISPQEAADLISVTMKAADFTKLPGFNIQGPTTDDRFPGFYYVDVYWDNPGGGGNALWHYAIEQTTGNVWDWAACVQYTSPALRSAQESLRRRIALSEDEHRKLRKKGPTCLPDDEAPTIDIGRPSWGIEGN